MPNPKSLWDISSLKGSFIANIFLRADLHDVLKMQVMAENVISCPDYNRTPAHIILWWQQAAS